MEKNNKNNIFNGIFLGDEDDVFTKPVITQDITDYRDPDKTLDNTEDPANPGDLDDPNDDPLNPDPEKPPVEEDPEYEVSLNGNPIAIIAKEWQEKGRIPSDFEIKDDLTPEQFEEAYREYVHKNTSAEIKSEVLKELKQEYGLDDAFLEHKKSLSTGIDPDTVQTMDLYFRLASVELDPEDEKFADYAKDLFKYYYADKDFSEEEILEFADRDIDSGDIAKKVEKVQLYFSKKGSDKRSEIEKKELDIRNAAKAKQQQFVDKVRAAFDSGKINNLQYTKEQMDIVKKAFFEKTEVIEGNDGSRERVTLFEKKTREYKNNFDLYMDHVVTFILGQDAKPTDISAAKQTRSILKDLNKLVSVDKKPIATKKDNSFADRGFVSEEIK